MQLNTELGVQLLKWVACVTCFLSSETGAGAAADDDDSWHEAFANQKYTVNIADFSNCI